MTELGNAKLELQALTERVAQLKSKIECMEKWEKEEIERRKALSRTPKEGYCIFDPQGKPMLWTTREQLHHCFKKFQDYNKHTWGFYEQQGYSVGPCIVKPIIRA
jgi:hypothetical protein